LCVIFEDLDLDGADFLVELGLLPIRGRARACVSETLHGGISGAVVVRTLNLPTGMVMGVLCTGSTQMNLSKPMSSLPNGLHTHVSANPFCSIVTWFPGTPTHTDKNQMQDIEHGGEYAHAAYLRLLARVRDRDRTSHALVQHVHEAVHLGTREHGPASQYPAFTIGRTLDPTLMSLLGALLSEPDTLSTAVAPENGPLMTMLDTLRAGRGEGGERKRG